MNQKIQGVVKTERSKVSATPRIDTFYGKGAGLGDDGEETGDIIKIPWEEVIHKHVRTSDNVDIGDVDQVGNEFIVVREGVVSVHMYYIPKSYINHYDGSSLWVSVPSGLVSAKFERKTEPTKEEMDSILNEAENNKNL